MTIKTTRQTCTWSFSLGLPFMWSAYDTLSAVYQKRFTRMRIMACDVSVQQLAAREKLMTVTHTRWAVSIYCRPGWNQFVLYYWPTKRSLASSRDEEITAKMKTFSQIRVHRLSSGVVEWTFLLQKNYRLLVSKKYYQKPLLGNSSKQVNIYYLALLRIFIFTISRSVFGLYLSFFVWPWKLLLLNKFHSIFGILLVKNSWTSTLRMPTDTKITSSLWTLWTLIFIC